MVRLSGIVRFWPRDTSALALFTTRVLVLFAVQGLIILIAYLAMGPPADLNRLPLGFRLDPIHAVVHLLAGIASAFVGFYWTSAVIPFLRGFALFYLGLAVIGTFTNTHLGMHLQLEENLFHWSVGSLTAIIAFGRIPEAVARRAGP